MLFLNWDCNTIVLSMQTPLILPPTKTISKYSKLLSPRESAAASALTQHIEPHHPASSSTYRHRRPRCPFESDRFDNGDTCPRRAFCLSRRFLRSGFRLLWKLISGEMGKARQTKARFGGFQAHSMSIMRDHLLRELRLRRTRRSSTRRNKVRRLRTT